MARRTTSPLSTADLTSAVVLAVLLVAAVIPALVAADLVATHIVSPQPSQPTAVKIADLDADGDMDVIVAMDSGLVWLENKNNAPGTFYSPQDAAAGVTGVNDADRVMVVGGTRGRPYLALAPNEQGEPGALVVVDEQESAKHKQLVYSSLHKAAPTPATSLAVLPVTIDGVLLPGVVFVEQSLLGLWVVGPAGKEQPSTCVLSLVLAGTAAQRWKRVNVGAYTGPASVYASDIVVATESELYLVQRGEYSPETPFVFVLRDVVASGLHNVRRMQTADFDGDGYDDVVVLTDGDASGSKLLYLHNAWRSVGDTFGSAPVQIGADDQLVHCATVEIADVNGDQLLDLVALSAPYQGGDVLIFLNSGTKSAPQWTLPAIAVPHPSGDLLAAGGGLEPSGLALGDLDGDGDADLMVSSAKSNNVFQYANDGLGNFSLVADLNVLKSVDQTYILRAIQPLPTTTTAATTPLPDFVSLSRDLTLLYGTNQQGASGDLRFDLHGGSGPLGYDAAIHGSMQPFFLTTGDVDGDGVDDIVTSEYASGRTVLLLRAAGDGQLHYAPGTSELLPAATAPNMLQVHLVDLDGDGFRDVLGTSYAGGWWLRNRGAEAPGVFEAQIRWLLGPSASGAGANVNSTVSVAWADFDGDGRLDVVFGLFISKRVLIYYQARGPPGTFDIAAPLELANLGAASLLGVAAGDLDGNGSPDVATLAGTSLLLFFNAAPQRNFSLPAVTLTSETSGSLVSVVDLDDDGANDLVVGTNSGDDLVWYRCTDASAASFAAGLSLAHTNLQGASWIDVADLDGDGDKDVLGGYLVAAATRWYELLSCKLDVQLGGDLAGHKHVPLGGTTDFWLLITNLGPDPAYGVALSSVFEVGMRNPVWSCVPVSLNDSDGGAVGAACDTSAGQGPINGLFIDLPVNTAVNISVTSSITKRFMLDNGDGDGDGSNLIAVALSIDNGDLVVGGRNSTQTASANLIVDLCPNDPTKVTPGSCGCGTPDRRDVAGNVQCSTFVGSGGFVALLVLLPVGVAGGCCLLMLLLVATAFSVAALRSRAANSRKVLLPPPYARLAYDLCSSEIDLAPVEAYLRERLGPFLDVVALMNAFDALLLNTDFLEALILSLPSPTTTTSGGGGGGGGGGESTPRHMRPDVQQSELALALVYSYHAHNEADTLLRQVLRVDLKSLLNDFRQDDLYTAMYRTFARIVGLRWLWNALALPLNELLERVLDDTARDMALASSSSGGGRASSLAASQMLTSRTFDHGGDEDDADADDDDDHTTVRYADHTNIAAADTAASTAAARGVELRSASSHLIQLNVHVAVQTMLLRITSSADSFPDDMRSVMQACRRLALSTLPNGGPSGASGGLGRAATGHHSTLQQQQQQHHAATQQQMLALVTGPLVGLLFNRFICPAIVQPRQYGLVAADEHLNTEQKRALASAAKLLLTYATGSGDAISDLGSSPIPGEQLMFTNHVRVRDFLDAISSDSYESDVDAATTSAPRTSSGGGGGAATRGPSADWGTDSTMGGSGGGAAGKKERKKLLLSANEALDLRTGPPAGRVPAAVRLDSLKVVYVHCARCRPKLVRALRKLEAKAAANATAATSADNASPIAAAAFAADLKQKHDLIVRFRHLVDVKHLMRQAGQRGSGRRAAGGGAASGGHGDDDADDDGDDDTDDEALGVGGGDAASGDQDTPRVLPRRRLSVALDDSSSSSASE